MTPARDGDRRQAEHRDRVRQGEPLRVVFQRLAVDLGGIRLLDRKRLDGHRGQDEQLVALHEPAHPVPQRAAQRLRAADGAGREPEALLDVPDEALLHLAPPPGQLVGVERDHRQPAGAEDDLADLREDGDAVRTRAPSVRKTRVASSATRSTSGSTGIRPAEVGRPRHAPPPNRGPPDRARKVRVSTAYESGARSSGPAITESMSAMSATVRAIGPVTDSESQASSRG